MSTPTLMRDARRERPLAERDHTVDTSALEREIDQLIYRLYGLTPDEIRLVEEAALSSDRRAEAAPDSPPCTERLHRLWWWCRLKSPPPGQPRNASRLAASRPALIPTVSRCLGPYTGARSPGTAHKVLSTSY